MIKNRTCDQSMLRFRVSVKGNDPNMDRYIYRRLTFDSFSEATINVDVLSETIPVRANNQLLPVHLCQFCMEFFLHPRQKLKSNK